MLLSLLLKKNTYRYILHLKNKGVIQKQQSEAKDTINHQQSEKVDNLPLECLEAVMVLTWYMYFKINAMVDCTPNLPLPLRLICSARRIKLLSQSGVNPGFQGGMLELDKLQSDICRQ